MISIYQTGRRSGLMVSVLVSVSSGPGLSTGWGHWVVFLGKTGTSELNARGNPAMD